MASSAASRFVNTFRSWEPRLRAVSIFGAGFGFLFTVPLVGKLPLGELFLIPWFFYVVWCRIKQRRWPHPLLEGKSFRHLMLALGITFVGYIVSDLYRGTSLHDLARGWARLVFLGMDIVALAYLLGTCWVHLRLFIFGFALGVLTHVGLYGAQFDNYWKFGFAYPLSFALPLLIPQRRTVLMSMAMIALGVLHIYLGARSLGAMCMLAGATVWLPVAAGRMKFLLLLGCLGGGLLLVERVYSESGVAEDAEGSTTERTAMLQFAANKFAESPLVGQGSWFTKSNRLDDFFARRAELRGEVDRVNQFDEEEIAVHSQILIALAEGGLLGGAFFIAYALLVARTFFFAATHDFTLRAMAILLLLNAAWDILMSTFSGSERLYIAVTCAIIMALRGLHRWERGQA